MRVIEGERVPIYVWGDDIDEGTLAQARNLAALPFAHHHVVLLPDAHVGYGMPIGGVLAAKGQVIPHAVGLDIGCGVRVWDTGVTADEFLAARDRVLSRVQSAVPTGFDWHDRPQTDRTDLFDDVPDASPLLAEVERAKRQVGTLGGGNHFIEFQKDGEGRVWAMLHSGSRNLGKQMAEHYDRIAKAENARTRSVVPPQWGLAHLAVESDAGREYMEVMDFCMRFAKENRRLIQEAVQDAVESAIPSAVPGETCDVHHNYASVERHFGEEVVVHRKGAVRAVGTVVIPGSMGTASYIAEGLASKDSFESCSHGAGRAMSRKAAKKRFAVAAVYEDLRGRGVELRAKRKKDVAEEAAGAYKDIEDVMRHQADLVRPRIRLIPLAVVKA